MLLRRGMVVMVLASTASRSLALQGGGGTLGRIVGCPQHVTVMQSPSRLHSGSVLGLRLAAVPLQTGGGPNRRVPARFTAPGPQSVESITL